MATQTQKRAMEVLRLRKCVTCGAETILVCLDSTCGNACCASCGDANGYCEVCTSSSDSQED